jgi:predicted metalloprotease
MRNAVVLFRRIALVSASACICLALASCGKRGQGSAAAPKQESEILFRRMQAAWNQIFTHEGSAEYRMARLAVYAGVRDTRCGKAAGGVSYCPEERLVAAEQGWLESLRQSGAAMLHYALARTLARHVQHELTIDERVDRAAAAEPAKKEELVSKREIQADCFVGLWRRFHEGDAPPLDALKQAARQWTARQEDERLKAVLDARLEWMQRGFDMGELSACNIFAEGSGGPPPAPRQPQSQPQKRPQKQAGGLARPSPTDAVLARRR